MHHAAVSLLFNQNMTFDDVCHEKTMCVICDVACQKGDLTYDGNFMLNIC